MDEIRGTKNHFPLSLAFIQPGPKLPLYPLTLLLQPIIHPLGSQLGTEMSAGAKAEPAFLSESSAASIKDLTCRIFSRVITTVSVKGFSSGDITITSFFKHLAEFASLPFLSMKLRMRCKPVKDKPIFPTARLVSQI
ncbi:MAG: hypothetical protein ACLPT6_01795 [Desulfobaccales bacterium]